MWRPSPRELHSSCRLKSRQGTTDAKPHRSDLGPSLVGDLSANVGATVQFWGAKWSDGNIVSGGPAPAAFKGFAGNLNAPSCPSQWTTDPGNSTPPPGTVGSDITVIVSSSMAKSGPVISGNVIELVTVHVEPGYQGDPGHGGFGTVTGVVSCGGGVPV